MGFPDDVALGVEDMDTNKLTIFRTSHGLKTLFVPVPYAKDVTIMYMVLGGSSKENDREYGMAHFLEHMFFKGTENRTVARLNRDLSLCGAHWNAFTSQLHVAYFLRVPRDNFDRSFELLADMFFNPVFPSNELEIERGVILEEISMYKDDPTASFFDQAFEAHYEPQFGHAVLGTVENIKSFQRDDFVDYRTKHYTSNNTILVVAGDIPFGHLTTSLENMKYLQAGKLLSGSELGPQLVRPKNIWQTPQQHRATFKRANIEQAKLLMLFPGIGVFEDDSFVFDVMMSVLGDGSHSILWNRIREELGLCYGISAYEDSGVRDDKISIGNVCVGLSPENVERCENEILSCAQKVHDGNYDDEILECAKQHLIGNLCRSSSQTFSLGNLYGWIWLLRANDITVDSIIEKYKSVTKEQVTAAARKVLRPEVFRFAYQYPE